MSVPNPMQSPREVSKAINRGMCPPEGGQDYFHCSIPLPDRKHSRQSYSHPLFPSLSKDAQVELGASILLSSLLKVGSQRNLVASSPFPNSSIIKISRWLPSVAN